MDRCGRSGDAATTRPRDSLKQPQPAEGEKAKVFVTGICRQDDDITGMISLPDSAVCMGEFARLVEPAGNAVSEVKRILGLPCSAPTAQLVFEPCTPGRTSQAQKSTAQIPRLSVAPGTRQPVRYMAVFYVCPGGSAGGPAGSDARLPGVRKAHRRYLVLSLSSSRHVHISSLFPPVCSEGSCSGSRRGPFPGGFRRHRGSPG